MAPPVAPCKLCGTTTTQIWSHIIPRWTYRRLDQMDDGKNSSSVVQIFDDVAVLIPNQDAEYMLCSDCERLIKPGEDYVADVALQVDGSFPALEKCVVEQKQDSDRIADGSALDIAKLLNFAASVIWRASASSLKHYDDIDLGEKYGKEFSQYLRGIAGFPRNGRLMVELLDPKNGPNIHRVIVKPEVQKCQGYRVYHFCVFGMFFRLQLGNALPQPNPVSSIGDTKKVYITDGYKVLESVARRATKVTPKGKLARRG